MKVQFFLHSLHNWCVWRPSAVADAAQGSPRGGRAGPVELAGTRRNQSCSGEMSGIRCRESPESNSCLQSCERFFLILCDSLLLFSNYSYLFILILYYYSLILFSIYSQKIEFLFSHSCWALRRSPRCTAPRPLRGPVIGLPVRD